MRLHLVALPHTATTARYASCAYTQKIVRFCRMMTARGWEIVLYGSEENEAPCAEHVVLISERERRAWFGDDFNPTSLALDWDPTKDYWMALNARAIEQLSTRADTKDLILLSTGSQKLIADAVPRTTKCEWTVGYRGIVTPFCAFESSSFMHEVYARQNIENGRDFDAVIPNFFDPDEFPAVNDGTGDYLLFIGRMTLRKGPAVAAEIAKAVGMRLFLAGSGVTSVKPGRIEADYVVIEGDHCEYVGEVGIKDRNFLMAGARAVLCPTQFFEPFGGVAVEAQMCGTPAITTDWGAFRETVPAEFRFRNLQQAKDAVARAGEVDHEEVRQDAMRFSLDNVAPQFEDWIGRLDSLWGAGWYEPSATGVTIPA